jgi:hypothetical protein
VVVELQGAFFDNVWEGLEVSVREAIWRKAFNLAPTTPMAGRRMITVDADYGFASGITPEEGERAALGLHELPKPPEQWWLGVVRNDEPS